MAWKTYCNANTCTGCNSLNVIRSASRWCYEDKFGLKRQDNIIRAKIMQKDTYIATGVIGHMTHGNGNSESKNDAYEWERNFNSVYRDRPDNYIYLIKEVCKTMGVDFKRFIRTLDKIYNEMGALNNEQID